MNLPLFLLLQFIYVVGLFAETFIRNVRLRYSLVFVTAVIVAIFNYILLVSSFPPASAGGIYIPFAVVGGAIAGTGYLSMYLSEILMRTKQRKWYLALPLFMAIDLLLLLILAILTVGLSPGS